MSALPSTEDLARLAALSAKLRSQDPIPSRSEIAAEIDAIREVLDRREAVPVAWRSLERKFYRSEWPMANLLEARNGGLVTDEGEAWSYRYTHKDGVGGEYDMLTRREPVAHPPRPSASVVEALITEPGAPPPRHLFTTRPQATEQTP